MADIVAAMSALRERHGTAELAGIGIGVPGFIQFKEGIVRNANNLPFLENFAMRDALEQQLNSIVILENDANAAALGEKWMGAGRDTDDLILLTLGTGIGGGIISGGRILRGYLGMAGELGHISVVPNGYPCGCGSQGCVEKYSSATAVSAMARLLQLGHDLTAKEVFDIAQGSDARAAKAREIFRVMGESLGLLLATLINTFNFPLYLLERRHAARLGTLRAAHAAYRDATLLHLPHHRSHYANRPGYAWQRSRALRRGLSAVG